MRQGYAASDKRPALAMMLWLLATAGCAGDPALGRWVGPQAAPTVVTSEWRYQGLRGKVVRTTHYQIHTTIDDAEVRRRVAQVMEGALSRYQTLAPTLNSSDQPLRCFVFASRPQWAQFTAAHAGPDAKVYLQINRGGYTVGDVYVAYYIGDVGTYSVAAHEGWHQYVARNFRGRLPPFLEEGLACMFENLRWSGGELPQWNLSINPARCHQLRRGIESKRLWSLEELIAMHAGQVVNQSGERVETFYAQNWAFARFLWEAEKNRYRPALQRLLADTAAGTVRDATGTHQRSELPWDPRGVRAILEHYLQMDLPAIEQAYRDFMHKVAYEQLRTQWGL